MSASVRQAVGAALLGYIIVVPPSSSEAATFVVDSRQDAPDAAPGDAVCATDAGACTLRAAVQEANALSGADSILVPADRYTLRLTRPGPDGEAEDAAETGDLDITDDLTITGDGIDSTVINGGRVDRVFEVFSPAVAEITGMTISGGQTGFGGGIYNSGTLTLSNVRVAGNRAAYILPGEGVCDADSAGIENGSSGSLTLTNAVLDHNRACGSVSTGGALSNYGNAVLTNVTVAHNRAARGGGLANRGSMTLTNVTIAFNRANSSKKSSRFGSGGAIFNGYDGTASLTNVTIFRNRANNPDFGAAIDNIYATTGWVTLRNSIVASNGRVNCRSVYVGQPPGPGLAGFIVSLGGNLDGDPEYSPCGFVLANDLSRTDPRLAPAGSGGIPQPLALLGESPAIDAGDDAACPATDGRGAPRPADGNGDSVARCDIGAYEVQP